MADSNSPSTLTVASDNASQSANVQQFTILQKGDGSCQLISVLTDGTRREWLAMDDWRDVPKHVRKISYRLWLGGTVSTKDRTVTVQWRCCGDRERYHTGENARYCVLIRNRGDERDAKLIEEVIVAKRSSIRDLGHHAGRHVVIP